MVRYSLIAGELTLATYAYEDAQTHFERGLADKEDQPMDDQTAALLFGLACARTATVDNLEAFQEVQNTLSRIFDYYANTGNVNNADLFGSCFVGLNAVHVAVVEVGESNDTYRFNGMS